MFRQVRIAPNDVHLQRILWSWSPHAPIRHYVLLTVTYGEACAPYLALRTLKQLCADEGSRFPLARQIIEEALYMDDFLAGSHDLESTKILRDQLRELLTADGFILQKWVANDPKLLDEIPVDDQLRPTWMHFATEGSVSELGVSWDPVSDAFKFRAPKTNGDTNVTKRKALAELAGIFDPIGWLAPLTLVAKLVIQDLWRAKLDWDENLPRMWAVKWLAFRESMTNIVDLSVPRWFGHSPQCCIELHAFSDASRRAMAAVLYSRAESEDHLVSAALVAAKTKLASIKSLMPPTKSSNLMTILRLELQAVLIAAKLLQSSAATLSTPMSSCHLWCDSQVVLHWVQSGGPVGNDLVDNYVAHIQELTVGATWHYVPTNSNPADVASRGTDASQLANHSIWWTGPDWLSKPKTDWPASSLQEEGAHPSETSRNYPTSTIQCQVTQQSSRQSARDHIQKYSTLGSLLRATAWVVRLFCRKQDPTISSALGPITASELRHSFVICVKLSQRRSFPNELTLLTNSKATLSGQSPLKTLEPFLDEEGVLRVGGRLDHSLLPYDERHPVLLDGQCHLSQLILHWAHERSLHGGFRATYARVIQKAWIVGGKV